MTARFKPALKRCVIVAGPRKKGVLMMHGLVKELSVVHLGEGLGSVALANQWDLFLRMKDGMIVFIGTGNMSLSAAHIVRSSDDR